MGLPICLGLISKLEVAVLRDRPVRGVANFQGSCFPTAIWLLGGLPISRGPAFRLSFDCYGGCQFAGVLLSDCHLTVRGGCQFAGVLLSDYHLTVRGVANLQGACFPTVI